MIKAPVGTIVYAKKHSAVFRGVVENPMTIVAHERKRSGLLVAVLDSGEKVSFGELTDVPCSKMECGRCKWHNRESRSETRKY